MVIVENKTHKKVIKPLSKESGHQLKTKNLVYANIKTLRDMGIQIVVNNNGRWSTVRRRLCKGGISRTRQKSLPQQGQDGSLRPDQDQPRGLLCQEQAPFIAQVRFLWNETSFRIMDKISMDTKINLTQDISLEWNCYLPSNSRTRRSNRIPIYIYIVYFCVYIYIFIHKHIFLSLAGLKHQLSLALGQVRPLSRPTFKFFLFS